MKVILIRFSMLFAIIMVTLSDYSILALNLNPTSIAGKDSIQTQTSGTATGIRIGTHTIHGRRAFLHISAGTFAGAICGGGGGCGYIPPALAVSGNNAIITQTIKVTPVSHTFVSSFPKDKAPSIKPLRENDSTRYFTNARVVHTFYDGANVVSSMKNILDLTVNRKKGEGAGVTPGTVHLLSDGNEDSNYVVDGLSILNASGKALKEVLEELPAGDVLFLPPTKSQGTVANDKTVQVTGKSCGLEVGGGKSGGVISILLNGPEAVVVSDNGYITSTILWYDV